MIVAGELLLLVSGSAGTEFHTLRHAQSREMEWHYQKKALPGAGRRGPVSWSVSLFENTPQETRLYNIMVSIIYRSAQGGNTLARNYFIRVW